MYKELLLSCLPGNCSCVFLCLVFRHNTNKMGGGAQQTTWKTSTRWKITNHSHSIMFTVHCRGVAARVGNVHLVHWVGSEHMHHPVPQGGPFSKKFWPTTGWKSTKNLNSTGTMTYPYHNCMGGLFHSLFSSQTVLINLNRTANGGGVTKVKGHAERAHPLTLTASDAQLQKPRPNLRLQASIN